ncbi:MAG: NAD(P)-dependent oxidoreductase [Muricomes sp.]
MAVHQIEEAKRCLNCRKPQCQKGCPISTPIPAMIQAFNQGKLNEAGKMLFENNPMSLICSLICNHEKQCEGHCILGKKGQPVHISSIENYISDTCFERMELVEVPKKNKKVAVIGAGPAGLTIAVLLARKGYYITIFDAKDRIGGILQYGIPEFRLPKSILERYRQKLIEFGIWLRPNTAIGESLTINDLFRDGYKSIFIGTGVWKPKALGIKGESLGKVHFAIDYLANPDVYSLGKKVAIIGMGNSAMDVARTAIRKGASEVTLYARGLKSSASESEIAYAKVDGARLVFGKKIVEITEEGPVFCNVHYDEDENVLGVEEETIQIVVDSTIIAVSQGPKNRLVSTTEGLKATDKGLLETNDEGETTREGIFAAGDVVLGAKTVVEAAAYSKIVAQAMDDYMEGLD